MLQPFQQRVVDEKKDLDLKIGALDAFWSNPLFETLLPEEKTLLERQSVAMKQYSSILGERISAFT
jgi:hypothetical protein